LVLRRMREVAVAALIALLLAAACEIENSEQVAGGSGEIPDEIVSDFTTAESDSGRVRWKLTAPKANKFNARKVFVMDQPRIEFFDDAGRLQTTLVSDNGEYFSDSRDMLAYGNVVVVSVEGDVLETDSLRYVNDDDKITSDSFVKLTRGDDVITGYGLECDHNLSSVDIKRDVKATIRDDEGKLNG
jgi:LPS export ABC transporter protein LptC